jgi:hypothetical protein
MLTSSLELKLTACLTKYNIHVTLSKNNICVFTLQQQKQSSAIQNKGLLQKNNPPELPNFEEKDFEVAILRQWVLV